MQKQHHHLHTQEKILRYELAQKRKLLTELKEELEYCREKWLQAREKNSTTEAQWKQLRTEFASRKTAVGDDFNNSLESGYSDERESSSAEDEEPGYDTDVSESHNKISSPEPVSEDVLDDGEKTTDVILEVVRDEITEIESEEVVQEEKTDGMEEKVVETKAIGAEGEASTSTVQASARDASLKRLEEEVETKATAMTTEQTIAPEESEASASRVTTEETIPAGDEKLVNEESASTASTEDRASARDARLKRLEEETKLLMNKVSKTTLRSWQLDVKLENLHGRYGESSGVQNAEEARDSEEGDGESP